MAAISKHHLDIYNWIMNVINTSNPLKDLNTVDRLINNYAQFLDRNTELDLEFKSMLIRNLNVHHTVKIHSDRKEI